MKTQTTDKATARPWRIENYRILSGNGRTSISSSGLGSAREDLELIVKAVNEHAALVAVAEASFALEAMLDALASVLPSGVPPKISGEFKQSLSNLKALRTGSEVAK